MTDYAALVSDVIRDADLARPRSQQQRVGVSGIGGCRRQAAYRYADVPPSDESSPHPSALLGTWIHDALLPLLAERLNGKHEVRVRIDDYLVGSADLWADTVVLDLKTVGDWAYQRFLRDGPGRQWTWQVHLYAHGLRQLGVPIDTVVVVALNRGNGQTASWQAAYDQGVTDEALDWWTRIREGTVEDAPRDEHGPGLSIICDGCPWRTACWGPDAQAAIVKEGGDESVAQLLAMYEEASALEAKFQADKDFARTALLGTEPGEYGGFRLSWRRGRSMMDTAQVKSILESLGQDIPTTTTRPSISVTRVR